MRPERSKGEASRGVTLAERLQAGMYDLAAAALFLPLGGLDALREQALDALELRPGTRVLELGCGTGGFTAKLIRRRAAVTAVDRSAGALRRTERRAPGAELVRADLLGFSPSGEFDLVLLAFVLHELDAEAAGRVLSAARSALAPDGRVAVLDWAEPPGGFPRWLVRGFVRLGEPASAGRWLDAGAREAVARAGLAPVRELVLARGAARLVLAAPPDTRS